MHRDETAGDMGVSHPKPPLENLPPCRFSTDSCYSRLFINKKVALCIFKPTMDLNFSAHTPRIFQTCSTSLTSNVACTHTNSVSHSIQFSLNTICWDHHLFSRVRTNSFNNNFKIFPQPNYQHATNFLLHFEAP